MSRIGEIATARAEIILKSDGEKLDLKPIRQHTDEAGLGCLQLAPTWTFEAYDAILAVDIGGNKVRCGLVEPRLDKASDRSKARVWHAPTMEACGRKADPRRGGAEARQE